MEVLNACNDNIDVVYVEEGILRYWYKLEDKFFNIMPSDATNSNNTFKVKINKTERLLRVQF